MKTAISLPDDLFKRVERKAREQGWSRSEFFARAAEQFLESLRDDLVTASYDEAFGSDERDATSFRRKAMRRSLLAVEWKE